MKRLFFTLLFALSTASVCAASGPLVRPVKETYVGENFLSALALLGIGPEFEGRTISYLVFTGDSANGKGQIAVSVNGKDVTDFQTINGAKSYTFSLPKSASRIVREADSLQFHLRGNIFVDSVGVQLMPGYVPPPGPTNPNPAPPPAPTPPIQPRPDNPVVPPPPPPEREEDGPEPARVSVSVRQYFLQSQILAISSYVRLGRVADRPLKRITLYAMSRYGTGRVTYCGNFGCKRREVGAEIAPYSFAGHGETAREAGQVWRFGLSGDFWVERIDLEFAEGVYPSRGG